MTSEEKLFKKEVAKILEHIFIEPKFTLKKILDEMWRLHKGEKYGKKNKTI